MAEGKGACTTDELSKRISHLLDLNIERCRIMETKKECSEWVNEGRAEEIEAELL